MSYNDILCGDCYMYDPITKMCYVNEENIRPVNADIRDPGCERGIARKHWAQFPYYEKTCDGCSGNCDNEYYAPSPCACKNARARPRTEADGKCPYWTDEYQITRLPDNYPMIPCVTSDVADMIIRGINDKNFAYWEVDYKTMRQELSCETPGVFNLWIGYGYRANISAHLYLKINDNWIRVAEINNVVKATKDETKLRLYRKHENGDFEDIYNQLTIPIIDDIESIIVPEKKKEPKIGGTISLDAWLDDLEVEDD